MDCAVVCAGFDCFLVFMKIHEGFSQNSLEWLQARAGVVTASEMGNLLTDKLEPRKGQMVETYLSRKVAEAWLNGPLPGYNTIEMEIGQILESEAIPWFEFETGVEVRRVPFITTDCGRVGCSPDGLLPDGGIEIKCPQPHTHVGYIMTGTLPECYAPQVYGSMYVTGLERWNFISYNRQLPKLNVVVESDDQILNRIDEAVGAFLIRLEAAMQKIENMAGRKRPVKTFGFSKPVASQDGGSIVDVIP